MGIKKGKNTQKRSKSNQIKFEKLLSNNTTKRPRISSSNQDEQSEENKKKLHRRRTNIQQCVWPLIFTSNTHIISRSKREWKKIEIRRRKWNQTILTKKSLYKCKNLTYSKLKPLLLARFLQISKNFSSSEKIGIVSPWKPREKSPQMSLEYPLL